MKNKKAFTLAEALMTLTIIGIIATITIPSVISNHKTLQYKTAYKKALKTINETISLNIAKGEKSALYTDDTKPLYDYLKQNLDVIKTTTTSSLKKEINGFYTADNMRFDFPENNDDIDNLELAVTNGDKTEKIDVKTHTCGTKDMGIGGSTKALGEHPCIIMVDVNGDKGPNRITTSLYKEDDSTEEEFGDIFFMLITDKGAFPYGLLAQEAYYGK